MMLGKLLQEFTAMDFSGEALDIYALLIVSIPAKEVVNSLVLLLQGLLKDQHMTMIIVLTS